MTIATFPTPEPAGRAAPEHPDEHATALNRAEEQ